MNARYQQISFQDTELWKKDDILHHLAGLLDRIRLVSLDVFDTLLFRGCSHPSNVFWMAGQKAKAAGLIPPSITAYEFSSIRKNAEFKAHHARWKMNHCEDVTLEYIYEQFPESWGERGRLLALELETEQEIGYVNPNAASLLHWCKGHGIKVVLTSDMYLSARQITGLLEASGLDCSLLDDIFVSSEKGCSKLSGGLYDELLKRFSDIPPDAILHIGDNEVADVARAMERGITAVYYPIVPEKFESPFHWESIRHGDVLPELKSIRKLAGCSGAVHTENLQDNFFYRFGAGELGPFLHALCEWAIDTCIRENRDEIHPLMREAVLLGPMLEQAARMRGVSIKVTPIYISRQATYLPSIRSFGAGELEQLMRYNWVKVQDLFSVLEIDDEAHHFHSYLETPLAECHILLDESGTTVTRRLISFLLQDHIQEKINRSIERNRKLFIDYLTQQCGSLDRLMTLDIGFHGSIQQSLDSILQLANIRHHTIHLMAVGTERSAEHLVKGLDLRCFIGSAGEHGDLSRRFARSPAFLEELMMGDFGTTLRFEQDAAGIIRPVLAELMHHKEEFRWKRACHEGVRSFQHYYDYLLRTKPNLVTGLLNRRREWGQVFHRVMDMPTPEEACMLGTLTCQDNFCGVKAERVCESLDDKWFAHGADGFIDVSNLGTSVLNVFWPQGTVTLRYPYYLYSHYLKLQDSFGTRHMLFNLMCRLKEKRISVVNIFGTGSFAETVAYTAAFHGIKAAYLIDPFTHPSDSQQKYFTQVTLEQAIRDGNHIYILATLQDMNEYRVMIEQSYRDRPDLVPGLFEILDI